MINSKNTYSKINSIPIKFIPIMFLSFLSINLLALVLPLTMKKIYSSVILSKSVSTLRYLIIGALIALTLEAIMRKVKDSSSKWISAKYEYTMTTFLIRKILSSHEIKSHDNNYISNLEKFNSISKVTTFYSSNFYQLFIDLPFTLLFLYLIYVFGGELVFIPITLSAIYIILILMISKFYFNSRITEVENNDELIASLTESLEKIHIVKAAGLEDSQIRKFKSILDINTQSAFVSNRYKSLPKTISSNISQLNLFSILIFGGYLMNNNQISFAEITACALLGGRAISPIISLMNQYLQRKDIQILKERIDEIAYSEDQYASDIPEFPDDILGTIEIIGLEYNDVQTNSTKNLNFNISSGDFVLIEPTKFLSYRCVFNNLIGKSPIKNGKILIDNLDISEWNMNSLKGKIEYLNDNVSIYKGSVLENITFFNTGKIQNAYEAAALTGLETLVSQLSDGFETQLDSFSKHHLSSAFMQRLSLTRALLDRPRILIIDRIDESMDNESLEIFMWLLSKFKGKLTIIIASNNNEIKELSNKLLNDKTL